MPEFLKSFGLARLGALIGVTAALFGFFFYLTTEMIKPPMSLLYSGLDARDAAEIVAKLDAVNVPYELTGDGTTILVPQSEALRLRMQLAGDGLPAGGSIGYEIFDNQDALGATSFLQNVNLLRALEGELARTIRALDVVDQARVHLVIPKRELFARETPEPTASIVIRPRGQIGRTQVQAIQNLVASAVGGLTPARVSVIDDKGQLLGGGALDANSAEVSMEERKAAFEERLRAQVEQIVSSVVGPGKARVQVSATLDFNRITKEIVTYDPDGQVVRSTQSSASTSSSTKSDGTSTGTSVSVANSLPSGTSGSTDQSVQSADNKSNSDERVEYEISSERKTEVLEGGNVERLSVAVVVDGKYTTAEDGTRTYEARSADEMAQITALVRTTMGFQETRGDTLEVANLQFAEIEFEPLEPVEEPFLGLTKDDIIRLIEFIFMGILAVLMIFFVFRPLIARLTAPASGTGTALATAGAVAGMPAMEAAAGGVEAMAMAQGQIQQRSPGAGPAALPSPTDPTSMIDIARVHGQVKESSVKKVGEIVSTHPDEAMSIMRSWLHEAS